MGKARLNGTVEQSVVTPATQVGSTALEVAEYPDSDGEPMAQNNRQLLEIVYAIGALRTHFRDRPDVHVRGDMFIYYRKLLQGMEPADVSVVPDVFVVIGDVEVPESSYKIWEVGIVPQFVMEVASGSTSRRDQKDKYDIYERLGFEEFWWFDPTGELMRPADAGNSLMGWRLGSDERYRPLADGPGGELRSDVLGLDLCVVEGRLRFWDYENGKFLQGPVQLAEARVEADRRASDADRRARDAELRAQQAKLKAQEAQRRRQVAELQAQEAEAELARLRAMLAGTRQGTGPS